MKREIEFLPVTTFVFDSPREAMESVAREMANWIRTKRFQRGDAVLGFSTGDPVEGCTRKIREMSGVEEKGGLPISGVRTVEYAELAGRGPDDPTSFRAWMRSHLFEDWGATEAHQLFLDGSGDPGEWAARCAAFEEAVGAHDPVDVALTRLGPNGRLGLNEPGSAGDSVTRVVDLTPETRAELAAAHDNLTDVPAQALTAGVATIRSAKRLRVFAFGAACADAVDRAMDPDPDPQNPFRYLHGHKDLQLLLDADAARHLA